MLGSQAGLLDAGALAPRDKGNPVARRDAAMPGSLREMKQVTGPPNGGGALHLP